MTMMGQTRRPTSHYLLYLPCVSLRYAALPCLGLLCLSFSILCKEKNANKLLSLSSEP